MRGDYMCHLKQFGLNIACVREPFEGSRHSGHVVRFLF